MDDNCKYKYIVVEDEPLIRKNIIKKIENLELPLSLCGEAPGISAAKEIIEKHIPSIVITDIQMPGGSGLDLAKYIYEMFPHIRIVIISGYSDFKYAQQAIKHNVNNYLLKPVKVDDLKETLQRILITLNSENNELASFSPKQSVPLNANEISQWIKDYIRQNYSSNFLMSELAETLGYSVEYIGRIFKQNTGLTPSKYLTKVRINQAKMLLQTQPALEVGKIGDLVGYSDSAYFSRVFNSLVGIYPTEYRKNPPDDK